MDLHGNAALSWSGRRELARRVVEQGWTLAGAAEAAGVSVRCARKWVGRYRGGDRRLLDRSSAPLRVANRTAPERLAVIVKLRRLRMSAAEIAETLAMPLSTVSGILTRLGLGRLGRLGLEPACALRALPARRAGPHRRQEARPDRARRRQTRRDGKQQHYTAQLHRRRRPRRRKAGWEFVHIAVDDYSRLAYAEVLADEKATTAAAFLRRTVAFYRRHGIRVERVLTDNGSCYRGVVARRSPAANYGIRHLRTRPRRPQTNGKAERFIRTLLAGWAYGAIYGSSHERTATLDGWLWHYNHRRRHSALSNQPPISRTAARCFRNTERITEPPLR